MPLPSIVFAVAIVFAVEVRCNSEAAAMGVVLCFMFLRQRSQTKNSNSESVIQPYEKECENSKGKTQRPEDADENAHLPNRERISEPED